MIANTESYRDGNEWCCSMHGFTAGRRVACSLLSICQVRSLMHVTLWRADPTLVTKRCTETLRSAGGSACKGCCHGTTGALHVPGFSLCQALAGNVLEQDGVVAQHKAVALAPELYGVQIARHAVVRRLRVAYAASGWMSMPATAWPGGRGICTVPRLVVQQRKCWTDCPIRPCRQGHSTAQQLQVTSLDLHHCGIMDDR